MTTILIKNTITINAPVSKVCDALINSEQTKKYMFGCEVVSDWKAGSPLLWNGTYKGKEMPVSSYYYMIFSNGEGSDKEDVMTGTITLIKE